MFKSTKLLKSPNDLPSDSMLSIREAAEFFGIGYSSMARLVQINSERLKDYISVQDFLRFKKPNKCIDKNGMIALQTIKNTYQKKTDSDNFGINQESVKDGKKQIAEMAMNTMPPLPSSIKSNLEILKGFIEVNMRLAQEQEKLTQKQEIVETAVDKINTDLYGDGLLNSAQRFRLNDRVRAIANHIYPQSDALRYSRMWTKIHSYMGHKHLEEYPATDYMKVIKYLRALYDENNYPWN